MSACVQGEDRSLGDGKSASDVCALFIVLFQWRVVDVLLVRAGSLHGSQDDSVLQISGSHADGLEYLWDGRSHRRVREQRNVDLQRRNLPQFTRGTSLIRAGLILSN